MRCRESAEQDKNSGRQNTSGSGLAELYGSTRQEEGIGSLPRRESLRINFSKSFEERSLEILLASFSPEYVQGDFCEPEEAAL